MKITVYTYADGDNAFVAVAASIVVNKDGKESVSTTIMDLPDALAQDFMNNPTKYTYQEGEIHAKS